MKIDTSSIQMAASHAYASLHTEQQSLKVWIGDTRPDFEGRQRALSASAATTASISAAARQAAQAAQAAAPADATPADGSGEAQAIRDASDAANNDPKLQLIRSLLERMTGQTIRTISARDFEVRIRITYTPAAPAAPAAPQKAGFGVEFDAHVVHDEVEATSFQVQGVVQTSDGQTVRFSVSLAMSRSFHEESSVSLRLGDAVKKDPLVINFNGTAAELQNQRVAFDLSGDGTAQNIPLLASHSGYLALDLNGNQAIDSGKELFGPASGNGFVELARHDADGNGWIDANDPVFSQLKVWTPAANGQGQLTSLAAQHVAAIYLGASSTPFALKDAANQELGAVRATGVYLGENGTAGTVQQIDLTV